MGIYGYSKETTSFLSQIPSRNLIVFSDVISPHSHTTLSLRKILTFQNYENDNKEWYEYNNLINIFNSINYQTLWISNQDNYLGVGSSNGIASLSSKQYFVSGYKSWYDEAFLDEKVLPIINKEINTNKNQFFVIHLMGTHASYGNRYPRNFNIFEQGFLDKKQRIIARYDNAVLYDSYVVNQIFNLFAKTDSIIIFISDHGEELMEIDDFVGHSDDRISRFMVEIPMIFYVSDIFIKKHPTLYQKLKESSKKPYMTDDLIHTILDIAQVKTEDFDPQRSIINQNFNISRKRLVGNKKIDYDTVLKNQ